MHYTRSAIPLARVKVEQIGPSSSEVWLRKDIVEASEEVADGVTQTFYDAYEVNGVVAGVPAAADIEAEFDAWWDDLEEASLTDAEKFDRLEAQVLFTALMTDTEV